MDKFLDLFPDAFKEAVKEAFRVIGLSILPIILLGIDSATGNININWKLVLATAILTVLRFIDKWLHEIGKEQEALTDEPSALTGGLTRF